MKQLFVLGTNPLVGQIVETVFDTELTPSGWSIVGVYDEDLESFESPSGSVLVIDRRLVDCMVEKVNSWCSKAAYLVPFDETDFDNIHECFRNLLRHGAFCKTERFAAGGAVCA